MRFDAVVATAACGWALVAFATFRWRARLIKGQIKGALFLSALFGGALWAGHSFCGASLQNADAGPILALGLGLLTATVASFCLAGRQRSLLGFELFISGLFTSQLIFFYLLATQRLSHPGAPEVRLAILWPAALWACGTFGASVALVSGFKNEPTGWRLPLFLAWRLLVSPAQQSQSDGAAPTASDAARTPERHVTRQTLATVTRIAGVGVLLGVWLVLVALGVLSGFENDLTEKIMGSAPHVALKRIDAQPLTDVLGLSQKIAPVKGVVGMTPLVESEVAVASSTNYVGGIMLGVQGAEAEAVLPVLSQLRVEGVQAEALPAEALPPGRAQLEKTAEETLELDALSDEEAGVSDAPEPVLDNWTHDDLNACNPLCPAYLGSELARSLAVGVGSTIRVISPTEVTLSPLGVVPKSLGLKVAGLVTSKLYDFDGRMLLVGRKIAARFGAIDEAQATALAIAVDDPQASTLMAPKIMQALGSDAKGLEAQSWQARNQTLFAALALERIVAGVVLAFIILVAAFAVVNTLTMHIFERRWEIAMLKAMGASDTLILRTFVLQGLCIGVAGTAFGVLLGLCTLGALGRFRFWIPHDGYYIDAQPGQVWRGDVVWVVLAGLLLVWDFAVWPSIRAAALRPAWGLRDS